MCAMLKPHTLGNVFACALHWTRAIQVLCNRPNVGQAQVVFAAHTFQIHALLIGEITHSKRSTPTRMRLQSPCLPPKRRDRSLLGWKIRGRLADGTDNSLNGARNMRAAPVRSTAELYGSIRKGHLWCCLWAFQSGTIHWFGDKEKEVPGHRRRSQRVR